MKKIAVLLNIALISFQFFKLEKCQCLQSVNNENHVGNSRVLYKNLP